MSDEDLKSAEAVALASLQTAENISRMMFEAAEAQARRQQEQLHEVADLVARLLSRGQP